MDLLVHYLIDRGRRFLPRMILLLPVCLLLFLSWILLWMLVGCLLQPLSLPRAAQVVDGAAAPPRLPRRIDASGELCRHALYLLAGNRLLERHEGAGIEAAALTIHPRVRGSPAPLRRPRNGAATSRSPTTGRTSRAQRRLLALALSVLHGRAGSAEW